MSHRTSILALIIATTMFLSPRADARFSSGGSSSHSSSSSHSFSSHSFGSSSSSSHSYSSGKGYSSSSGYTHSSSTFGHAADRAASEEESHATFSHSTVSPTGSSYSSHSAYIPHSYATHSNYSYDDARDLQIRSLRSQLSWERYQNRPYYMDSFFHPYYGRSYVTYSDGYSPWFWFWLMDQTTSTQASWIYNHQATMDAARYQSLLDQNQSLQAQITQLQQQQTTPDPTYTPPGLPSADMMYSDNYVSNVMSSSSPVQTPTQTPTETPTPASDTPPITTYSTSPSPGMNFLYPIGIFAACCGLYWLFFVKRWSSL
jgi:hypothetical protein